MNQPDLSPKLGLTAPLTGLHFVFFFLFTINPEKTGHLFAFVPGAVLERPWTVLTYPFLVSGLISLLLGTYVFYWLGSALEAEWGTTELGIFWLVSTLTGAAAAFTLSIPLAGGGWIVNYSMFFAFAYLYPDMEIYLFFAIPVKVKILAFLGAAYLGWTILRALLTAGLGPALVLAVGSCGGFLYFWIRHHGRDRARRIARDAVTAVKEAGHVLADETLERRNRALFPRVEALRAARAAGGELPREQVSFEGVLKGLVAPGVKICKPVDFKGDKDGVCVRCEGFAECSLRYVAGQPEEIKLKERS